MIQINFYTKDPCPLCDEAIELLKLFENEYPHTIERRDITENIEWLRKFRTKIPVLQIQDDFLKAEEITYENLETFLKKHSL